MDFSKFQAAWIWTEGLSGQNLYADFVNDFTLDVLPDSATVLISADSDYALYINGRYADAGHYDDFPSARTYDAIDVAKLLKAGKNRLAVLGFYQGIASHQYFPGEPGVIFALISNDVCLTASGKDTLSRPDPMYRSGEMPVITGQLGFSFDADARADDGWISTAADASLWNGTAVLTQSTILEARPVEKLTLMPPIYPEVIAQGRYLRREQSRTVAQAMFLDYLSPLRPDDLLDGGIERLPFSCRAYFGKSPVYLKPEAFIGVDGAYAVLDLEREEAGLFILEIEAEAGTVIDIAWGEHLNDLRVRSFVNRNFAARYTAKQGRQSFIFPFKRFGGRFLELHISKPIIVFALSIRPWEYPLSHSGAFCCPDSLHNKIWQVCRRTLELCMHEHYEDTPWREQAFYIADSRNQALCGYYAFGEYRFPAACFSLYSGAFEDDFYADICAPSISGYCIPSFVLTWPVAIYEQYLFSGDNLTAIKTWPAVKRMTDDILHRRINGLIPTFGERGMWNFYEWSDGLGGDMNCGNNRVLTRLEAPLQLMALRALDAVAALAGAVCGDGEQYRREADCLRKLIHKTFWQESRGVYATFSDNGELTHECQLTQALAITLNVVPAQKLYGLRRRLALDQGLIPTTLAYSVFKYEALLSGGDEFAAAVFDEIARDWGHMLYSGATSFWETIQGAKDFHFAGSLCHGWSAVPLYLYMRFVLGIYPKTPGFKTFTLQPVRVFDKAHGSVPTPYGNIDVDIAYDNTKADIHINIPKETSVAEVPPIC